MTRPKIDIEAFAPYPKREEDVTADVLARHLAAMAQARLTLMFKRGNEPLFDAAHSTAYVLEYGVVSLLRSFAAIDQDQASTSPDAMAAKGVRVACNQLRHMATERATALEPVIVPCECPDQHCPNRVAVQLVGDEDRAEATALEPSLPLPVADGREVEQGQERSDGGNWCDGEYAGGSHGVTHTCGLLNGHAGSHLCRCTGLESYTWPAGASRG